MQRFVSPSSRFNQENNYLVCVSDMHPVPICVRDCMAEVICILFNPLQKSKAVYKLYLPNCITVAEISVVLSSFFIGTTTTANFSRTKDRKLWLSRTDHMDELKFEQGGSPLQLSVSIFFLYIKRRHLYSSSATLLSFFLMASAKFVLTTAWSLTFVSALVSSLLGVAGGQLMVRFYSSTCPNAEDIIISVVSDAVQRDPTIAAALLRLHYHDCFVRGCDGSVLIRRPQAEMESPNHAGLRGFQMIEDAKTQLETECPGTVSCADIVALAARDSIVLSNGPSYQVPTGRRDGRISNVSDADNMPEVEDSIQEIKAKFFQKGLSEKDLVLLSAAHTIGTTACFFLQRRLYDFTPGSGSDPSINPEFLPELMARCPKNGNVNVRLALDRESEFSFDDSILRNIRDGFGVIETDAKLYDDESTRTVVDSYMGFVSEVFRPIFESDFTESIVKMGQIGVKTGSRGEIRRVCSQFN
ncbi:peroxidase 43-like [Aristolochia californica]|uniref:peroxidase 43-like n=1 Tax=Aristolochia californica TaxID=171875 RepID=UPI0035D65814